MSIEYIDLSFSGSSQSQWAWRATLIRLKTVSFLLGNLLEDDFDLYSSYLVIGIDKNLELEIISHCFGSSWLHIYPLVLLTISKVLKRFGLQCETLALRLCWYFSTQNLDMFN